MSALTLTKCGVAMFLHPLAYSHALLATDSFELIIIHCEKYLARFRFNAIVVASCRHLYHLFCALIYFRKTNKCAKLDCDQV